MGFNTAEGRAEITAGVAQDEFDFVFKIYEDEDIVAWLTPVGQEPDDVADLLVLGTDYTIVINGDNGGVFTLTSAASAGDAITLVRNLDSKRFIEYPENGDLRPAVLNADQNYQTYLIFDSIIAYDKVLRLPKNSQGVSTIVPNPFSNSYLKWNEDGTAIENDTTIPQAVIDSAASAAAALVSELAAAASAEAIGDMVNIDTIADLRAATSAPVHVYVTGYNVAKDGAFGSHFFRWNSASVEADNGGTIIKLDAITTGRYELKYSGAVNVRWFGAKGDGAADDYIPIQSVLDNYDTIYIPSGTYLCNTQLSKIGSVKIYGDGKNKTIIKDGSTVASYFMTLGGTAPTQISNLSADAVKDTKSFSLASSETFLDNDIVMIYNPADYSWSSDRAEYRAGEMCRVSGDSSSSAVALYDHLVSDYVVADVDIYKMNNEVVEVRDFSVIANGVAGSGGMQIKYAVDSIVDNISVTKGSYTSFSILLSYNIQIRSVSALNNKEAGATGTNYGLAIVNSQYVNVSDSYLYGYRHGLTTGGGNDYSVSCRFITITNCNLFSDVLQSLDMHGNSEFFNFSNNNIEHGIVVAGDNHLIAGNNIHGELVNGAAILFVSCIGYNMSILNNRCVISGFISGARGNFIDAQVFDNIVRDSNFLISGNNVKFDDSTSDAVGIFAIYIYKLLAATTTNKMNISIIDNMIESEAALAYSKLIYVRSLNITNGFTDLLIANNNLKNTGIKCEGKIDTISVDSNKINGALAGGIYGYGLLSRDVSYNNNIIKDVEKTGMVMLGLTDESSIEKGSSTNNKVFDCNKTASGASSTDSSLFVSKITQFRHFGNFMGSPASAQSRDYAVSVMTDFYHGSNVLVTGSSVAVNNTATTTTVI